MLTESVFLFVHANFSTDCIEEELPPATELEENLRNGVYLAKIAHFCAPHLFPATRIFDADQRRWREQVRTKFLVKRKTGSKKSTEFCFVNAGPPFSSYREYQPLPPSSQGRRAARGNGDIKLKITQIRYPVPI